MRSREEASYAFNECLGHLFSLVTWNNLAEANAVFKYYKAQEGPATSRTTTSTSSDVAADVPQPAGGGVAWNNHKCDAESTPAACYSVEGDWLRFFWDYLGPGGPGLTPTLGELTRQVKAVYAADGFTAFNVYPMWLSSLDDQGPYEQRVLAHAAAHGVNYPH